MKKRKINTNGPISPMYKLIYWWNPKAQWRKGTWVPSFSNGRLLRPSQACSPYNEKMKMWVKELQAYPLKREVDSVNSNLVQYLLQTDIQKRTEKIQWQIQTLHRDFSPGNPNRENQHILYSYIVLHCLQYNIHIGASGIQNPNPMTWISPKP